MATTVVPTHTWLRCLEAPVAVILLMPGPNQMRALELGGESGQSQHAAAKYIAVSFRKSSDVLGSFERLALGNQSDPQVSLRTG